MKLRTYLLLFWTILLLTTSCSKKYYKEGKVKTNAPEHIDKPYVLLISLDGYRWDYTKRFRPPNLSDKVEKGVSASSMLSCFPSKTFPNHYSIATGMYPENHGIINNSFYDADKGLVYKMGNREIIEDGSWYGGTPLWVNAAQSGMVSASFFFVGSEANIKGIHPTYFYHYDGSISNETRIQQIIDWFYLPEKTRPHLVTAYFSDMDDEGHRVGPNSDEALAPKLKDLDASLGKLFKGLEQTGLPINVIIVSDHGMAPVPVEQMMPIEAIENDEKYKTINVGAIVHIYVNEGVDKENVFQNLKAKEEHYSIFKIEEAPFYQSNRANPRLGDFLIIPEYGWYFKSIRQIGFHKKGNQLVTGQHGFDPSIQDLHAIFYAFGPAFKEGLITEPFENIHVYPIICEILGLDIPKEVDGDINVLKHILR